MLCDWLGLTRCSIGHPKRASLLKMDAIADVRSKLEFEQFHSSVSLDGLRTEEILLVV